MAHQAPLFPTGPPPALCRSQLTTNDVAVWIERIELAPTKLREAIDGLDESGLNAVYRSWSIRQIVHHIADSHVNSYVRFMLAMTEEAPTIRPYDEQAWSELDLSSYGDAALSLNLLDATHQKWVALMRSMNDEHIDRVFVHPSTGDRICLAHAIHMYAWHGEHHTAQIVWLRQHLQI